MSRTIRQRKLRERRTARRRAQLTILLFLLLLAALSVGAWAGFNYLKGDDAQWPHIKNLKPELVGENSIVYDRNGDTLGYIASDQNRKKLKYDQMGEWAPRATVAIEDQRFYHHHGVDPKGMARALSVNIESGDATSQGASTITQQVVRNLYSEIGSEKKLSRKAKEATLAIELEDRWSKKHILQEYLNLVFYGHNAYGIEAAALTYFNKDAKDLTIPEAALLAGLPQQPSTYDPYDRANRSAATKRRNDVLKAMHAQGMITKAEYAQARATPIKLTPTTVFKERKLPYFFDYVEKDLIHQYGVDTVRQGGLKIHTTVDPRLQKLAEQAVRWNLPSGGPSGAIVVLDTKSGDIRAMASTASYEQSQFNRAAQAQRQPGSTAKVWVLATFVSEGVNPDSTYYTSRPIKVRYPGASEWWEPKTYSGSYSGSMSIRSATTASDNSVYAQMTLDMGPEKVAAEAHKLGITSPLQDVWSIGLGSQVVTPLEQTNFYSTIARGGVRIDPRAVSSAITPGGTKLALKYPAPRRVMQDWQADTIRSILRDNVLGGTGTAASGVPEAAGKTGTTDDSKDAWFCGMTPELTACVWMGYDLPTPMPGVAGGGTPARIWADFMGQALDRVPSRNWFTVTGSPVWVPWTVNRWQTSLGLDVQVGSPTKDDEDEKDKDKKDQATDAGTTPATDPTTTSPTDPGGGTTPPTDPGGGTTPPVDTTPTSPTPPPAAPPA